MQLDSFSLPGHVIHPLRWNLAWKRTVGSHFLWLGHGWLCWTQKWRHKFYCRYVTQFAATCKCLILGHFLINIAKYQDNRECTFTSWMTESASAVLLDKLVYGWVELEMWTKRIVYCVQFIAVSYFVFTDSIITWSMRFRIWRHHSWLICAELSVWTHTQGQSKQLKLRYCQCLGFFCITVQWSAWIKCPFSQASLFYNCRHCSRRIAVTAADWEHCY